MSDEDLTSDGAFAASFAGYLGYRELLIVLARYSRGFQITLIRGHAPEHAEPTYRAIIYKLLPKKPDGQTDERYHEWEAEGMGSSMIAAIKTADSRAQRYLKGES